MKGLRLIGLSYGVSAIAAVACGQAFEYHALEETDTDFTGNISVSAQGDVIVAYLRHRDKASAIHWAPPAAPTRHGFDDPSFFVIDSGFFAVSGGGSLVATIASVDDPDDVDDRIVSSLWEPDGGFGSVLEAPEPYVDAAITARSQEGQIATGYYYANTRDFDGIQPLQWLADGTVRTIPLAPGYPYFEMEGASSDGSRILMNLSDRWRGLSFRPAIWSEETGYFFLDEGGPLDPEPRPVTPWDAPALAISADGTTVVGGAGFGYPYFWTEPNGFSWIHERDPRLRLRVARDVSHDGSVIVGWADFEEPDNPSVSQIQPFVSFPNGDVLPLHDLLGDQADLIEGWQFSDGFGEPLALSDDGRVLVGLARQPDDTHVIWRMELPPASACIADFAPRDGCVPGERDGLVLVADFACYLSAWTAASPVADITDTGRCTPMQASGDGVDLSDLSCYLAHWARGCR